MARLLAVLAALTLVVAAPATAKTVLNVTALASGLKFDKTTLTAKAGVVVIRMKNLSPLPHDIAIKGKGVNKKGKTVGKGGVSVVTATLKPGVYVFYCSVPGHEAGGMKGRLVVK